MQVTKLGYSVVGQRFRIVGEPEAESWKKSLREGHEPWCEFTVSEEVYSNSKPTGRLLVSAFGGELWPSAWPSMFSCHPNAMTANGTVLTEHGKKVLGYS